MYFSIAVRKKKGSLSFTWITSIYKKKTRTWNFISYYINKMISQYLMDLQKEISTVVVLLINLCKNNNILNLIKYFFCGWHSMLQVIIRSDSNRTINVQHTKEPLNLPLWLVGVCMLAYLCLTLHCKAQLQPYLSYSKSTMIERHR